MLPSYAFCFLIPTLPVWDHRLICTFISRPHLPYLPISPIAGIIRTALSNMDREAREHYAVVIQAKDMAGQVGGLSGSTTVNITLSDVNDNPPKFPQSEWACHAILTRTITTACSVILEMLAKKNQDGGWALGTSDYMTDSLLMV